MFVRRAYPIWSASIPVLAILLLLPGSLTADTQRFALLVGVTKYENTKIRELKGCANDTTLLKNILIKRFGFLDQDRFMHVLTEGTGRERLPTQQNILRELKRLADTSLVKKGDQVVILLAGHGGQQKADWTRKDNYEPDGLDEVFLPRDTGEYDTAKNRWPRAITDDDLREAIDEVAATGALVTLIIDACHSGTMLRDTGQAIMREVPLGDYVSRKELDAWASEGLKRAEAANKETREGYTFAPTVPNVAALFAVLPHQTTPELPFDIAGKDEQWHGLLTYTLCEVLEQIAGQSPTLLDIRQQIQLRYSALGWGYLAPTVEGKLAGHTVFDCRETLRNKPSIVMTSLDEDHTIDAGRLSGLTEGSILAVYTEGVLQPTANVPPLGYVQVTTCRIARATVEPVRHNKIEPPRKWPRRALCWPVVIAGDRTRIGLALSRMRDDGQPIPEAEIQELRTLLKPSKNARWQLVDDPTNAWNINRAAAGSSELLLYPPGSAVLSDRGVTPTKRLQPTKADIDELAERLDSIAHTMDLMNAISIWERSEKESGGPVDVSLRLSRPGAKEADSGARQRLCDGEDFNLEVLNTGNTSVDITLLLVNERYRVKPLYPTSPGAANRLPPGMKKEPNKLDFRYKTIAREEGMMRFIVIAVEAKEGSDYVEYRWLAETKREQAEREVKSRKPMLSPHGQSFDRFLLSNVYPTGKTRDVESRTSNVALAVVECDVGPRR